jgi:predicted outer membrane repeat protein
VVTGNRAGNGANGVNSSDTGGNGGHGGGIHNDGILTLLACVVTNNITGRGGHGAAGAAGVFGVPDGKRGGSGGHAGQGGGVKSVNTLTCIDSLITSNHTGKGGDGARGGDAFNLSFGDGGTGGDGGIGGAGGGMILSGSATMTNCDVLANATGLGGAPGAGGTGALGGENGSPGYAYGAGEAGGVKIYATSTFSDCVLANNSASYGGGIDASGALTLNNCSVNDNHASVQGGGIFASGALTLNDCTLDDNSAGSDGGGIYNHSSTLTVVIRRSTFAGNSANASGGGIYNAGRLGIENSTFAQNQSNNGGGIYNSVAGSLPVLALNNCTISGNVDIGGGGAAGLHIQAPNTAFLTNTIVAGNISGANIIGPLVGANNITSGNPILSTLNNYGGATYTMPPLSSSPAINAGLNNVTNFLATDQRGYRRHSGPSVDIGAVEVQQADPNNPPLLQPPAFQPNGALQLTFTNDPAISFSVYAATNVAAPTDQWIKLGTATQTSPGHYRYTDTSATIHPHRFYKVVWP